MLINASYFPAGEETLMPKCLKWIPTLVCKKTLLSWFTLHKNAQSDLKSNVFFLNPLFQAGLSLRAGTRQKPISCQTILNDFSTCCQRQKIGIFRTDSYINVWINKVTQMSPNAKTCISERQIWIPVLI